MTPLPKPHRDGLANELVTDVAELAAMPDDGSRMIGYVIMSFYDDGASRSTIKKPTAAEHKIGSSLFAAWVRQKLNEHLAYREGVNAAYAVLEGDA